MMVVIHNEKEGYDVAVRDRAEWDRLKNVLVELGQTVSDWEILRRGFLVRPKGGADNDWCSIAPDSPHRIPINPVPYCANRKKKGEI